MSEISSQFDGNAVKLTATLTDTLTTIIGPLDLQVYEAFVLYSENLGGGSGDDITVVNIETAPTLSGPWVNLGVVAALPLTSGASTFDQFTSQANKFVRVQASCAATDNTTVNFWFAVKGVV